ncbi:MAG: hypothetical protein MJ246_01805 [Clostridia bacterium]|nr:hypothetical protein [Clostridia bacterium]
MSNKKKNIDEKLNELKTKKAMAKVENEMEEARKKENRKKLIKAVIISLPTIIVILACIFLVKYYFDHKAPSDLIKIHEDTYMTDMTELLANHDMYIGRPVEIEGYCKKEIINNDVMLMVYRLTPGTDGNNGICGIDFKMLDSSLVEDKDKIRVYGKLESYMSDDKEYLRINAEEVEVLPKDKKVLEYVYN